MCLRNLEGVPEATPTHGTPLLFCISLAAETLVPETWGRNSFSQRPLGGKDVCPRQNRTFGSCLDGKLHKNQTAGSITFEVIPMKMGGGGGSNKQHFYSHAEEGDSAYIIPP